MRILVAAFIGIVGVWSASSAASSAALAAEQGKHAVVNVGAELASHVEIDPLDVKFERLSSLQIRNDDKLLACDSGAKDIKVIDPQGKLIGTIQFDFAPQAIDVAGDGTIYCGGQGHVAKLDKRGELLRTVKIPKPDANGDGQQPSPMRREQRVSGIAVSKGDVFVAVGSQWSLRSRSILFRFDRNLENLKLIVEDLRGCCQRCDIVTRDGIVYIAENTRHRVDLFDREGKLLDNWGQRSRNELEGFGSCCNPMNLCFDKAGVLYTSESGLGRVKRYTTKGKFLGLAGYVGVERFTRAGHTAASCSNMAVAITADGRRIYVMDYGNNLIRVLRKK